MSKEDLNEFMMLTEADKSLKEKYNRIMYKLQGKNATDEDWNKVILEELIPLAKENGFELSLEEIKSLGEKTTSVLSDDELREVVGGSVRVVSRGYLVYCHMPSIDEETFRIHLDSYNNDCIYYTAAEEYRKCYDCGHFNVEEYFGPKV